MSNDLLFLISSKNKLKANHNLKAHTGLLISVVFNILKKQIESKSQPIVATSS